MNNELKLVIHPDAIVLAREYITIFRNNKNIDKVGKTTLQILRACTPLLPTPEELCKKLFFTRQSPVYAEFPNQCIDAGYSSADWRIMRHITPIVPNVKLYSDGDIRNPVWKQDPIDINVVGLSGVLRAPWADGGMDGKRYQQLVKEILLPTFQYLANSQEKDLTFVIPAIGCGVWNKTFDENGKFTITDPMHSFVYKAINECIEQINKDTPNHGVKNVQFCDYGWNGGTTHPDIMYGNNGQTLLYCKEGNKIDFPKDSKIFIGMAGDPYAPLGSDVFKGGQDGETGEKFVIHTNIGSILYGIDGDTVVQNDTQRKIWQRSTRDCIKIKQRLYIRRTFWIILICTRPFIRTIINKKKQ